VQCFSIFLSCVAVVVLASLKGIPVLWWCAFWVAVAVLFHLFQLYAEYKYPVPTLFDEKVCKKEKGFERPFFVKHQLRRRRLDLTRKDDTLLETDALKKVRRQRRGLMRGYKGRRSK